MQARFEDKHVFFRGCSEIELRVYTVSTVKVKEKKCASHDSFKKDFSYCMQHFY